MGRPAVIGMLGGMSWESTAEYYRLVNELVRERLGGLHSARCLVASVDFAEVERMQAEGRWDDAAVLLAEAARGLEAGGADLLLLCTNTMHKVADEVAAAITVPFVHLADATADTLLRSGVRRVGLLGTAFTMEQDFYRDRLSARGVEVVLPGAEDRAEVHRVIYEELCLGVLDATSRERYRAVIARLVTDGAEAVVLGCTEIGLLVDASDSAVPLVDTTRVHAEAAVDLALRGRSGTDPD